MNVTSMIMHESRVLVPWTIIRKTLAKNKPVVGVDLDDPHVKKYFKLRWKDDQLHPIVSKPMVESGSIMNMAGIYIMFHSHFCVILFHSVYVCFFFLFFVCY